MKTEKICDKMEYELIEAPSPEQMDELEKHISEKIEPSSFVIGKPIDIVRFILKTDLKEYKLIKKDAQKRVSKSINPAPRSEA